MVPSYFSRSRWQKMMMSMIARAAALLAAIMSSQLVYVGIQYDLAPHVICLWHNERLYLSNVIPCRRCLSGGCICRFIPPLFLFLLLLLMA